MPGVRCVVERRDDPRRGQRRFRFRRSTRGAARVQGGGPGGGGGVLLPAGGARGQVTRVLRGEWSGVNLSNLVVARGGVSESS